MSELAGRLQERVTITRPPGTRDAAGGTDGDPVVGSPLWAAVAFERAAPGVDADRAGAPPRYRITLRAEAAPRTGDRLRWRGETLTVVSVARDPLTPDRVTLVAEMRP